MCKVDLFIAMLETNFLKDVQDVSISLSNFSLLQRTYLTCYFSVLQSSSACSNYISTTSKVWLIEISTCIWVVFGWNRLFNWSDNNSLPLIWGYKRILLTSKRYIRSVQVSEFHWELTASSSSLTWNSQMQFILEMVRYDSLWRKVS